MYGARPRVYCHQRASVLLYFVMGSNLVEVCRCAVENRKGGVFFCLFFVLEFLREEFAKEQTEAVLPPHQPHSSLALVFQLSTILLKAFGGQEIM